VYLPHSGSPVGLCKLAHARTHAAAQDSAKNPRRGCGGTGSIDGNARGACCCAQLLDALAKNSALTSLDLSGNSIGEEGAQVGPRLCALRVASALERLDGGFAA